MISILYWNVYCLPGLFTSDKINSDDRARMMIPHLGGYDVVILNEAWTEACKNVFRKAYPFSYSTPIKCGKILDSGILILSKYKILNPSHIFFSASAGWDWFASKGAVHFKVSINNKLYDIFTTHMQAGYSDCDQKSRMIQVDELSRFINSKVTTTDALVIGDLNVMPLINGNISNHTNDYNDALQRSKAYFAILKNTNMMNFQKGNNVLGVYHLLYNNAAATGLVSHQNPGLSDGPFLTLDYTS